MKIIFRNYKYIIFGAMAIVLILVSYQPLKHLYFSNHQKKLEGKFQDQIYSLKRPQDDDYKTLANISEAQITLGQLKESSTRLSIDNLDYEKNYLVLESLDQYFSYRQKYSRFLSKFLEYDAENDLNSRSATENSGDFMYRLSLTQNALKTMTDELKQNDKELELATYTKTTTQGFFSVIDLVDRLISATQKGDINLSNNLRLEYVKTMQDLKNNLKPQSEEILKKLDSTIQKKIAEIKV